MSEGAQSSRNKDLKHYRRDHTRKYSRIVTNEDLLHLLLDSSDPFVTSLRPPRRTRNSLAVKALRLLAAPSVPRSSSSDEIMVNANRDDSSTSESDRATPTVTMKVIIEEL